MARFSKPPLSGDVYWYTSLEERAQFYNCCCYSRLYKEFVRSTRIYYYCLSPRKHRGQNNSGDSAHDKGGPTGSHKELSFAIGAGVNCNGSTVSGDGMETMLGDESHTNRWKNICKIKDVLKDALRIVRKLLTGKNLSHQFPRGVFCRFLFDQFSIGTNLFLRFFGIPTGRNREQT